MRRFQKVLASRIDSMHLAMNEAGAHEHSATTGFLRERYITELLQDMTPEGVSLSSGKLIDALGNLSLQLDLIISIDDIMPQLSFREGISMVPIESGILALEIKSKIDASSLEQVKNQNKSILDLKLTTQIGAKDSEKMIFPTMIVALDGPEDENSIKSWMSENGDTVLCCVIDKYTIFPGKDGFDTLPADGYYDETMNFLMRYWWSIQYLKKRRSKIYDKYIEADDPASSPLFYYLSKNVKESQGTSRLEKSIKATKNALKELETGSPPYNLNHAKRYLADAKRYLPKGKGTR